MKKIKHKTIDDYITIAKNDLYVYTGVTIIVFLFLCYISFKTSCYFYLLFNLVMIILASDKIEAYFNLLKIKKTLIQKNLIDKIGKIDFWNEYNYFLTENYVIIVYKHNTYLIKYEDIDTIYKETKFENGKQDTIDKFLHLVLKNGDDIKILIWSSALRTEEYKDIGEYLLKKNSNIKIGKNKKIKFWDLITIKKT